MRLLFLFSCFVSLTAATCQNDKKMEANPGFLTEGYGLNFTFNSPDSIYYLDRELREISGLAYSEFSDMLLTINDEKAYIYHIDPSSGRIMDKTDFGKADDYEGIAYHNEMIYIVESNGNIKVINERSAEKVKEYDDKLSRDNNIEGLCYNNFSNTLLLAAKGDSREDGNEKREKALFSMALLDGNINRTPFLSIDVVEEVKKLKTHQITSNVLVDFSVTSRLRSFAPSGVAIDPLTDDLYIISARGKLLIISDQYGKLKAVLFLKQSLHNQPEGLCFDTDGNLYISNEGRSKGGSIYKYHRKAAPTND